MGTLHKNVPSCVAVLTCPPITDETCAFTTEWHCHRLHHPVCVTLIAQPHCIVMSCPIRAHQGTSAGVAPACHCIVVNGIIVNVIILQCNTRWDISYAVYPLSAIKPIWPRTPQSMRHPIRPQHLPWVFLWRGEPKWCDGYTLCVLFGQVIFSCSLPMRWS